MSNKIRKFIRIIWDLNKRFITKNISFASSGKGILDADNNLCGYVDVIQFDRGKLTIEGWCFADNVRLEYLGLATQMKPNLERVDVAKKMSANSYVGFSLRLDVSTLASLRIFSPGLIFQTSEDQTPIPPVGLNLTLSYSHLIFLFLKFVFRLTSVIPSGLAWILNRHEKHKRVIIERLQLDPVLVPKRLSNQIFEANVDQPVSNPPVYIIIPVYNAFEVLTECLHRIDLHTDLTYRLILIEDCSTDKRVLPFLQRWSKNRSRVHILKNEKNLGFIKSVNRGFEFVIQNSENDTEYFDSPIILLNSDALVPSGWASRLIKPIVKKSDIASATPMSNDAEILNINQISKRSDLHFEMLDKIDALAKNFNEKYALHEIPTGVGFCMAISHKWLLQLPYFDEKFGKGYGEEVDWCRKILSLGGRHVCVSNLFVEHRGGQSFGSEEKQKIIRRNAEIVSKRHPTFDAEVQAFIRSDPLISERIALTLSYLAEQNSEIWTPVYLAHSLGGGAEHWLQREIAQNIENDVGVVVVRVKSDILELEIYQRDFQCSSLLEIDELHTFLHILSKIEFVYSCSVGYSEPLSLLDAWIQIVRSTDKSTILFHDYYPLAPSYNLLDEENRYIGPTSSQLIKGSHDQDDLTSNLTLIAWQNRWKKLAERSRLVVFSESSKTILEQVWPNLGDRISVRPHSEYYRFTRQPKVLKSQKIVLGVLGNIGPQKGANIVVKLASRFGNTRKLSAEIVIVGNFYAPESLDSNVVIHGSYSPEELPDITEEYGITHWLIPSIWPETFCYTVREALSSQLPVYAFNLGAQGEAVQAFSNGIPIEYGSEADMVENVVDHLAKSLQTH